MDPATVAALINLVSLGVSTFQQYANGTITAEQATKMFTDAATNLQSAIDAFNAAGGKPPAPP